MGEMIGVMMGVAVYGALCVLVHGLACRARAATAWTASVERDLTPAQRERLTRVALRLEGAMAQVMVSVEEATIALCALSRAVALAEEEGTDG